MNTIKQNNNVRGLSDAVTRCGRIFAGAAAQMMLLALVIFLTTVASHAQTAAIYGQLGNFDVVNHSGHDGHGFEIELEGLQVSDVPYTFSWQRYGTAQITSTATGVLVRWESTYTNGAFDQTTVAYAGGGQFGGSCYMGSVNYNNAGCEHFGASLSKSPIATHYRWLIEDPANPGTLIGYNPPVAITNPVYTVTPPAQAGEPPVLEAEIEAPEAPETPEVYGDAQWVKVFKTELTREVTLDELMSDNPIVPQDAAHSEVAWEIIQAEPVSNSNSNGTRGRHRNGSTLHFDTRSVIRRYESYAFTGTYDPITHEALCADLVCNAPADGEVGDFLGAQMAAANLAVQSLTVNRTGNGSVNSADRLIKCGLLCTAGYNQAAAVTLTASASSGNVFAGWGGACTGNALTCVVTINDATNVTANFAQTFSLSVKTSGGKGSITGTQGINCGKICSATVIRGTAASLTATPEAGFRFANWSGACTGSGTCNVTVNAATSVQANFVKQ
jgi:hypothetical protein